MSRATRQEAILDIVHQRPVSSQAELVQRLEERGLRATQATVSRDVRQLGLVKVPGPGGYRYLPPEEADSAGSPSVESLRPLFQRSVTEVAAGGALLVVRTPTGFADAVALGIDGLRMSEIVGTVAGDDTILVVVRGVDERQHVLDALRGLLD